MDVEQDPSEARGRVVAVAHRPATERQSKMERMGQKDARKNRRHRRKEPTPIYERVAPRRVHWRIKRRRCTPHVSISGSSISSKSSPCARAQHDARTWSPHAPRSLRSDPDVVSAARAGTSASPSRLARPTTPKLALWTQAPRRRTSWRGAAPEDHRCRTRIAVGASCCSAR